MRRSASARVGRATPRAFAALVCWAWFTCGAWLGAQEPVVDEEPARQAEWTLNTPAPAPENRTQVNPAWKEVSCAQCHETIAREWGQTLHAQAWNDELFVEELESIRRKKSCYGCHAPMPMLGTDLSKRPEVRPMWREHGVDCRSCHLGPEGAIHGPWGAPSRGHDTKRDETFIGAGSNELCIACHRVSVGPVLGIAKDFVDELLGERGLSCVGCHMAPVERSMAIDDYTGEPLPPRKGRSHLLQTPRDPSFLAQAFRLETERDERGVRLRIHNRAGHRIPGLEDRRIVFELQALDTKGEVLAESELIISRRRFLPFNGFSEVSLETQAATDLRIRATHDALAYDEPVVFMEREIELDAAE